MPNDAKITPFTFVNAINNKQNRNNLDEHLEKEYNPFLVNRSFSYFPDTIFYSNEINKYSSVLDNRQQFDFYYYLIPKRKRFSKWAKKGDSSLEEKDEALVLDAIIKRYSCSTQKAREILSVFSRNPEMKRNFIEKLKTGVEKGGKRK